MKKDEIKTIEDAVKLLNKQAELVEKFQTRINDQADIIEKFQTRINDQADIIEKLQIQIAWFNRQIFGSKSEKLMPLLEDAMLPGFESSEPQKVEAPEQEEVKTHKRKKRDQNGWNEIPKDLPEEEVIIDVPEAQRRGMTFVGYVETRRIARCQTRFIIKVIKRAKYADPSDPLRGVVIAPAVGDVLDSISGKTKFDVSFITGVVADKIENHLPIYRQAEMMAREGLIINRSTLQSLFRGAAKQFTSIYDRLEELIMQGDIIHGDETPIRMLKPGEGKSKKAYMWLKMSGIGPPLTVFHLMPSRAQIEAEKLFKDYNGTIIRDNYVGYNTLDAGHAGCWAHVRRKFFDTLKAGYRDAEFFITLIRELYAIESSSKERANKKLTETALFNERKVARRKSKQIVKLFFDECEQQLSKLTPSSPLCKAIKYAQNQRAALEKFLTDSRLNIDNNPAENVIRPLAIGRKNWLFAGSESGGQDLAVLASLAATCKSNNVNFRQYLEDVLIRLSSTPANEIDTLLPHLWVKSNS